MKLTNRAKIIKAILFYHLFRIRTPVYVGIKLTNRCNSNCVYCKSSGSGKEMSKKEIFNLMKDMKQTGTVAVCFTGGEPLLREDVDEIIQISLKQGFYTVIQTNGVLVPKKVKSLFGISKIKLSLDGPEKVHDSLRGKNSYKHVITAAELCQKHKIPIGFNTTVSGVNLNCAEYILDIARTYNAKVDFTPLITVPWRENDIRSIMPRKREFRIFFKKLINNKKYKEYIANSQRNLEYLSSYPDGESLNCYAGKLFCIIDMDGSLFPCPMREMEIRTLNISKPKFKSLFLELPEVNCNRCWCNSTLEFNLICDLNIRSMIRSLWLA